MLKLTKKYINFNGKEVEEDLYFNLTKAEIATMQLEVEGGFDGFLQKIIETENIPELMKQFQKIILMSYGVKSSDGRRFEKSEKLRTEFSQTQVYSDLFIELATDAEAAANFIKGVIPSDLVNNLNIKSE